MSKQDDIGKEEIGGGPAASGEPQERDATKQIPTPADARRKKQNVPNQVADGQGGLGEGADLSDSGSSESRRIDDERFFGAAAKAFLDGFSSLWDKELKRQVEFDDSWAEYASKLLSAQNRTGVKKGNRGAFECCGQKRVLKSREVDERDGDILAALRLILFGWKVSFDGTKPRVLISKWGGKERPAFFFKSQIELAGDTFKIDQLALKLIEYRNKKSAHQGSKAAGESLDGKVPDEPIVEMLESFILLMLILEIESFYVFKVCALFGFIPAYDSGKKSSEVWNNYLLVERKLEGQKKALADEYEKRIELLGQELAASNAAREALEKQNSELVVSKGELQRLEDGSQERHQELAEMLKPLASLAEKNPALFWPEVQVREGDSEEVRKEKNATRQLLESAGVSLESLEARYAEAFAGSLSIEGRANKISEDAEIIVPRLEAYNGCVLTVGARRFKWDGEWQAGSGMGSLFTARECSETGTVRRDTQQYVVKVLKAPDDRNQDGVLSGKQFNEDFERLQKEGALEERLGEDFALLEDTFIAKAMQYGQVDLPEYPTSFGGYPYIVLKRYEQDLSTLLMDDTEKTHYLGGDEGAYRVAFELLVPLLRAAHHFHAIHKVHQDIKPQNVLLERNFGLNPNDGREAREIEPWKYGLSGDDLRGPHSETRKPRWLVRLADAGIACNVNSTLTRSWGSRRPLSYQYSAFPELGRTPSVDILMAARTIGASLYWAQHDNYGAWNRWNPATLLHKPEKQWRDDPEFMKYERDVWRRKEPLAVFSAHAFQEVTPAQARLEYVLNVLSHWWSCGRELWTQGPDSGVSALEAISFVIKVMQDDTLDPSAEWEALRDSAGRDHGRSRRGELHHEFLPGHDGMTAVEGFDYEAYGRDAWQLVKDCPDAAVRVRELSAGGKDSELMVWLKKNVPAYDLERLFEEAP